MNILLLGSTGYLGGNIAKALSNERHKVYCVVRRTADTSRLKELPYIHLISNDPGQIELTFEQSNISWVINGVCTYKPNASLYGDMLESNVIFPLSVLNLSIKHHIKNFMTIGTGLPEDFNVYSFTKAKFSDFGRFLSHHDGVNFADLKLEMFYGGDFEPNSRFLKSCRLKLMDNAPIDLTEGKQRRDIIRVEDVTGIICSLIKSEFVNGYCVLPVGSGESHSIREILQYMKDKSKSLSELRFGKIPSRNGEPNTQANIEWYKNINYELKYGYFEGLDVACGELGEYI